METMSTENCTYAVPLGVRVQEQLALLAAAAPGVDRNITTSSSSSNPDGGVAGVQ
jgi:hypothetical protein